MSQPLSKITVERNQRTLLDLVSQPGNDTCADCKARNPRWASYNLGIFICVHCASIHRKIGTHITKVKSLTLDVWSKEQVETMKKNGNIKSNEHYNPDEIRHPPPTNMTEAERDSELEIYIRAKYENKRFIRRSTPAATKPLSNVHSRSTLISDTTSSPSQRTLPSSSVGRSGPLNASTSTDPSRPPRSVSQSLPSQSQSQQPRPQQPQQQPSLSSNPVWDDLISLQAPTDTGTSLPLQYQHNPTQAMASGPPFGMVPGTTLMGQPLQSNTTPYTTLSASQGYTPSFSMVSFNPLQAGSGSMLGMASTGMDIHGQGVPIQHPQLGFNSANPAMFMQGSNVPATAFNSAYPSPDPAASFGGMMTVPQPVSFQQPSPSFPTQSLPFQPQAFGQPTQLFPPQQPQIQTPMMSTHAGLSTQSYFQPQPPTAMQHPQQLFVSQPPTFGQQQQQQQQAQQPPQMFGQGNQFGSSQQGQQPSGYQGQWGAL